MTSLRDTVPTTYEEASVHQVWRDAIMEKYNSIMKNGVWEVVPRPERKSVVTSKWLYKIKHVADGIDYEEKFSPMARYSTIRSIISLASELGWKLH